MNWFDIMKIYGNEEENNLPREILDLLEKLEEIETDYNAKVDEFDYELSETCEKILDFVQNDANLEGKNENVLINITREHQRKSVSESDYETVYHYFTDIYTELNEVEE